jgi:hypothetical protein
VSGLDLKAEAVRRRIPLYKLAAEANVNPSRLTKVLNETQPMRADETERINRAIERLSGGC